MWAAILGLLQSMPMIAKLIQQMVDAWNKSVADREEARIAVAQKDMNAAKTPEEIKKAADEQAQAIRDL